MSVHTLARRRVRTGQALAVACVLLGVMVAAPRAMGQSPGPSLPSGNPVVRVGLLFGPTSSAQVVVSLSPQVALTDPASPVSNACQVTEAGFQTVKAAQATADLPGTSAAGAGVSLASQGPVEILSLTPDRLEAVPVGGGATSPGTASAPLDPTVTLAHVNRTLSVLAPSQTPSLQATVFTASGALVGPFASQQAAQSAITRMESVGFPAFLALPPASALSGPGVGSSSGSGSTPSVAAAPSGAWVRVFGPWVAGESAARLAEQTVQALSPVVSDLGIEEQAYVSQGDSLVLVGAGGAGFVASDLTLETSCSWSIDSIGPMPAGGDGPYAGSLILTRARPDAPLTVVNAVPLETYTAGVVPLEMPASWPAAALGAQAIASRTYALNALLTRSPTAAYILTDNTQDQMYGGIGVETASANAAVLATWGEIVDYHGEPIEALYEADSGGATASSVHVWGTAVPYLTHVDEPKGYVSPDQWTVSLGTNTLGADFAAASGTDVGTVLALHTLARGKSGRIIALEAIGTAGTAELTDDTVRTGLNLPSSRFALRSDAAITVRGADVTRTVEGLDGLHIATAQGVQTLGVTGEATLRGAQPASPIVAPLAPDAFTFRGQGDGPGLGMTQDGARFMAQHGATAEHIVLYYYRGTTVGLVPVPEEPAAAPFG